MEEIEERRRKSRVYNLLYEFCCISLLATCIKILLIPSYHSTDFEVHRHWIALTHSLPIHEWYLDETSPWTLDYPPFFAYFERFLSIFASFIDPQIVDLQKGTNYNANSVIYFQRISVIASDFVLLLGVFLLTRNLKFRKRFLIWCLVILSPSLMIVDHVHFQYNGFLFGILLISIWCLEGGLDLLGGFTFAVLLCFKHLFAVAAPVYFVYLLKHYCWKGGLVQKVRRILTMGSLVVFVFILAFGPFLYHGQATEVMRRMFPFGRGLCHAYWAPNFWALYIVLDKGAAFLLRNLGFEIKKPKASFTGGLVGDLSPFSILPQITPSVTFILVLIAMLPCLVKVWTDTRPRRVIRWISYAYTCGFVFGWHVHEKASLHFLIPLAFVAVDSSEDAKHHFIMSIGIKEKNNAILAIRNAVRYVRSSPSRLDMFKECVRLSRIPCKELLCLDVATRWNSTYLMLETASKFVVAFRRMQIDANYLKHFEERDGSHKKVVGPPTDDDWDDANALRKYLHPFYESTLKFSASNSVTSNLFFTEICGLREEIYTLACQDNCEPLEWSFLGDMAKGIKAKYDKYWGSLDKINGSFFIAIILDPRYKMSYLNYCFCCFHDDSVAYGKMQVVEAHFRKLFEEYNELNFGVKPNQEDVVTNMPSSIPNSNVGKKFHSAYLQQRHVQDGGKRKDEVDRYLSEDPEDVSNGGDFDILKWWMLNSSKYKVLSLIARDVLAIPVTTVPSEAAFSSVGRILDPFRSSLSLQTAEALICLRNWLGGSEVIIEFEDELEILETSENLEIVCSYSIFPLLYGVQEYPVKIMLLVCHSITIFSCFSSYFEKRKEKPVGVFRLNCIEKCYLLGIVAVEMWCRVLHPLIFGYSSLPFIPLMITSVYSAIGITYSWLWQLRSVLYSPNFT